MRSGELFAGVGGLGMAVDEVFGTTPAWFCEFDQAPSKVLAYRHPGTPNYGDVTAVDWKQTPRVQVLAGGFPCQDVSLAGRRRGMGEGTRSGLWSEYARAIDTIRPDWVVIENVRGLLSADANSYVEPCPLCVGDNPGHVLRALGAVLGDLADLGFDAEWTGIRASDVGAPHGRFRVFILAWPRERTLADTGSGRGRGRAVAPGRGSGTRADASTHGADTRDDRTPESASMKLLSTPDTSPEAPNTGSNSHKAGNIVGLGNQVMSLLPTPVAQPSGNTPEEHLRKKPGRAVVTDLAIITENGLIESGSKLLPTPRTTDMNGAGAHGDGGMDLRTVVAQRLLPTPKAHDGEFATPSTTGRPPHNATHLSTRIVKGGEIGLMSTPRATRGDITDWGPYADAIERWGSVIGRPAPAPVRHDGKGGKPRLNPELTEWMMGWPAGWVTDPTIGLSRAEQLKACGNGVVPQQAAAALREMLARPGVPAMREAVAA